MSSIDVRVSDREFAILKELAEYFYDEVDWRAPRMSYLAEEAELEVSQVRRAVRALTRKGLAAYERGLFDEDGMVAGSGYRATQAGKDLIERRQAEEDHAKELAAAQSPLSL